ncbi:hypothetical protein HETIRDRAFT_321745 [Heterobasidion irregulare TC 32-1]|uniref:Uncharacterized protein n=1 Tax=Heterobasidion irregulare (strain TC 32-1) TaxID=747525 RepID=W4K2Y3_HETIT|nr:uncharacterized protein HETIRDRAFT_322989 [Heterobasidion irregulare TC 32-1]XP_009548703.1 uncharacterized protein HETIRDRAFT_321745 [Heterobasidion irregulare TC 32-1]ETW80177.1 hypothetical protein HETIRDRAFT_322989 [Heterobasidion irregulare TC 32-1]ETW80192.1 hypothetical protein HETIRDRAFT_321745 [Heterobasidion irregulare TC 32-1]
MGTQGELREDWRRRQREQLFFLTSSTSHDPLPVPTFKSPISIHEPDRCRSSPDDRNLSAFSEPNISTSPPVSQCTPGS